MADYGPLGGVKIAGFISPGDTTDTYAVIDTQLGIDGLRNYTGTTNDVLSGTTIPQPRRRAGMIVGVEGGSRYFKLKDKDPYDFDLTDWEEIFFSASASGAAITGATYSLGTLTLFNGTGGTITATGFVIEDTLITGGTADVATQQLSFTNSTGGTFNVVNSAALFSDNDINVTGGTYNPDSGCVTFTTNSGSTFDICGFLTGFTDTYVTGGTLTNTNLTLNYNTGGSSSPIDLSGLEFTGNTSGSCISELHVKKITGCTGEDLRIGVGAGQDIYFDSTGSTTSPALYINSQGQIGIGTNSPFSWATADGTGIEIHNDSINNQIPLAVTETGTRRFFIETDFATTSNPVHFKGSSSTNLMTFNTSSSSARVGFGTTVPDGTLQIAKAGSVANQTKYPDETNIVINNTSNGFSGSTQANSAAFRFDHGTGEDPGGLITSKRLPVWDSGEKSTSLEIWNASGETLFKRIEILPDGQTSIFGNTIVNGGLQITSIGSGVSIGNLGFDINGNVVTGTTGSGTNTFVSGATLDGSTLDLERNDGVTVSVDLSSLTGSSEINTFVTGTTLSGNDLIIGRNDGVEFTTDLTPIISGKVDTTLFDTYTANTTDNVVTGATLNGTILELGRNNGLTDVTVDLSSLTGSSDTNTFVTGATLNNTTLDITRNDGVNIPVNLGSLTFTGNTSGTCINELWVANISGCNQVTIGTELVVNDFMSGKTTTLFGENDSGGGTRAGLTPTLTIFDNPGTGGGSQSYAGPNLRFSDNGNVGDIFYRYNGGGNLLSNAFNFISDGGFNFIAEGDNGSPSLSDGPYFRVTKGQSSLLIYDDTTRPRTDVKITNANGGAAYSRLGVGAQNDYWYIEADDVDTPMHIGYDDNGVDTNVLTFEKSDGLLEGSLEITSGLTADTLTLSETPVLNNLGTEVLVRNSTTGEIEYRNSSTFSGTGINTFVSGGTFDSSTSEITFTNTTGGTFNVDLSSLSGKTSFTVAGDNGTPFTISSGDTLEFVGFPGIDVGVADPEVRIALDYSGADSFILAATNGTGITVDGANDKLVIYDNDTATVKYINANQLPSSGAGSTPITGYSYNSVSNTFTIELSGGTSFNAQILEVSGITVNGDIIQTGTTSTFSNGNYVEIGTGFANTGQLTFNANHDGGVGTNTYTPVFAGNANAGMTVIKMPSGGEGGLDFYVKNHGVTSGSQNLNTFTKILELNQDGNSTFGGNVNLISDTPYLTLKRTDNANVPLIRFQGSAGFNGATIGMEGTGGTVNDLVISAYGGVERLRTGVSGTTVTGNLSLSTTPTLNNSTTDILVRNSSTGEVEYREASTLTGSTDTNTFVTGGTLSTDSLLTLNYNNGGFTNPIDLSTLSDGGDTITGFTYDKNTNTFSIGVSGSTSFDSQILKVSGITVENSMELGEYIIHSGDTNTYFGFNGTDSFVAFTNASRKLRIGTNAIDLEYNGNVKLSTISDGVFVDGKLGVGTDNPLKTLDVRGEALISNPSGNGKLTLSGGSTSEALIDFDNDGVSTPFARIEGSTFGGGVSGNLRFSTYPTGGPLSRVMVLTNNQRVGIGDITNNDVDKTLHVMGDFKMEETGAIFESDLNLSSGANVKLSAITSDQIARMSVATPGDGGITFGVRGGTEASFPGYGAQGDGYLYSSIDQNGLNIISAPSSPAGTLPDYIRMYAGQDADGGIPDIHIQGRDTADSVRGYVGINTDTPTETLHIDGTVRIEDGTEQNGYVLTCDANGVASWQPSSGGTGTVYWQAENGGLKSINQNAGSISGTSTGAILVGGYFNNNNITNGLASTIINGGGNTISGANASSIVSTNSSNIKSRSGANKIEYSVILGGSSNNIIDTINDSDRSTIIGGSGNLLSNSRDSVILGAGTSDLDKSTNGGLYNTATSTGVSISQSVILGGAAHELNAVGNSAILAGEGNTLTGDRSVVIGGQNINGTADDTVYVPNLNINSIGNGTPVGNLGFDSNGNVVTGTTGSGTSFWEEAGSSNEVLIDKKGSGSYTVNGESIGAIIAAGSGHTLTNSQYSAFLGGVLNTTINSSSLVGGDVQIGGLGNTISGSTGTHYGNINVGGSSNLIIASRENTMLGTTDSRIFGGNNNFIIGGGNHKGGIDGYGLYQNSSSGIIGGRNNIFENLVRRSVIIGGDGLTATTNDTVYVPNLNINSIGNGTPVGNLGFDSNGNVVTGTTGGGSNFSWSDPLVSSGNTSTDCLTNLYVANLRSCSPLYINPDDEGDVYFGSNSGVTIQTSLGKIGIGTQTPISKLHVNNGDVLISNENATLAISSSTVGGSGEYENRINFKSAGSNQSDKIDAQLRTESNGTRSNLFFGTLASNTLSDKMILTGRGRLGIGTMSPDSTLHISGSGIQQINVVSSTNNAILKLKSDDGNNAYIDFEETSGNRWLMGSYNVNDKFVWATGNTFSTGGLMGLTQDGDLGIGNISPSSRLHVNISSLPSLPTLGNDNVALFESDNETEVAIVGTEDRNVFLKFGDENSLDGVIAYDNDNKQFAFQSDGNNVLQLTTENVVNQKVVQLSEFGVGDPLYTLHVSRSGSTGNYKYNIISGNTGLSSDSCIDEFYVTNLESCSPLYINSQNQGDVYFGDQGGVPKVTLDITSANEPAMYFGLDSFIKHNQTGKKLVLGEDGTDGRIVFENAGVELVDVALGATRIRKGDLQAVEGNIIINSGNSKSLIVEEIPDVSGANLGTDIDGKLIDIPSDSRVKNNITEIPNVVNPLEFIQHVKGYQFEFKPETRISSVGKKHYGFKVDDFRDDLILGKANLTPSQLEINNIARTFVKKCKTKFNLGQSQPIEVDAMNYQDLIPFMIEGIKQLDTNINNISSGGSNKFVTTQTLSPGQNTINHNLNDENVIVQVIEVATGRLIIPDRVSRYLTNSVTIDVETGGEHKIIIIA